MKKIIFSAAIFIASTIFISCDKEEVITEQNLPVASREFLKTHFVDVAMTRIVKETEGFDKDYTVYLSNGFEVDFSKSGEWDEVDGKINSVPQSILDLIPVNIAQYVTVNFPDYEIISVNKEHYGYEIGLNGDVDIEFDSKGEFLRID
jgi:predicted deacetylase